MQSKGRDVEPNEGAERSARASVGRDQDRMKVLNEVRVPSAKQREYAEQREGAEAGHGPGGEMKSAIRYSRKQAKHRCATVLACNHA